MTDLYLIILVAVVLRCGMGLFPHSGEGDPPMYGDFEAQRHWMELTRGKGVLDWYRYDVGYWGLDYPPLSAFHAYVTSYFLGMVDPNAVELDRSRGYESVSAKAAMRASVILWDFIILFPAAILFVHSRYNDRNQQRMALWAIVCSSPLLFIDHGHFQYNGVSLGLFILAVVCVLRDRDTVGSMFFALSVNFKHMSLYFAPVFAAYVLGRSRSPQRGLKYLLRIGLAAILTTVIIWSPFEPAVVFRRLVPLERGLFEDKVASFWCSISPFLKLKLMLGNEQLFSVAAALTLISIAPVVVFVFRQPTHEKLIPALAASSLSCFLYGYQVHEKQILLPQMAVALMTIEAPTLSIVFSIFSCISIYPLLAKEGLSLAYFAVLLVQAASMGVLLPPPQSTAGRHIVVVAVVSAFVLHTVRWLGPEISRLPDLYNLLFTGSSCVVFIVVLVVLNSLVFSGIHKIKTK